MKKRTYCIVLLLVFVLSSCKEEPIEEQNALFSIQFVHKVDDVSVVLDTQYYYNAAGNKYLINEIKYFISALQLYHCDGTNVQITQDDGIHYVDTDYPQTLSWDILQSIPEGAYDSIGFVFGLRETDNYSYRFVNPPQSNMAWPQLLGGGYHYMMINGWFERGGVSAPLNIHLGKGQIYQGNSSNIDSLIGFVDNYFQVTLPKSFLIRRDQASVLAVVMNIENWFKEPFVYDFNYWGSHIMQNQAAMQMLKENGRNVFGIK